MEIVGDGVDSSESLRSFLTAFVARDAAAAAGRAGTFGLARQRIASTFARVLCDLIPPGEQKDRHPRDAVFPECHGTGIIGVQLLCGTPIGTVIAPGAHADMYYGSGADCCMFFDM